MSAAAMRPRPAPTREDLASGGASSAPVAWVYAALRGAAPRGLKAHEVAERLGWPRSLTLTLLRRCWRLRVADQCAERGCGRWLPGAVNPTATSADIAQLVGRPEGPFPQVGDVLYQDGQRFRVVSVQGDEIELEEAK